MAIRSCGWRTVVRGPPGFRRSSAAVAVLLATPAAARPKSNIGVLAVQSCLCNSETPCTASKMSSTYNHTVKHDMLVYVAIAMAMNADGAAFVHRNVVESLARAVPAGCTSRALTCPLYAVVAFNLHTSCSPACVICVRPGWLRSHLLAAWTAFRNLSVTRACHMNVAPISRIKLRFASRSSDQFEYLRTRRCRDNNLTYSPRDSSETPELQNILSFSARRCVCVWLVGWLQHVKNSVTLAAVTCTAFAILLK